MAEKIKIFQLDIDVEAAIKSTANLKDNADSLKAKYDALKKSTSASTEEVVRAKGAYDAANKEYRTSQREIEKLTSLKGKEIKTIDQGRKALSVVSAEWAKQADLYGKNSVQADKLAKKKTELTARLKEMESQTGDNTRNVGNYTEGMKGAIAQTGIFQRVQTGLTSVMSIATPVYATIKAELLGIKANYVAATTGTKGYSTAQKAAAIATNLTSAALKVLKVALISTGIGAIVVALGSLIAYLSTTQQGIDAVSRITTALSTAFDVFIDRAAKFGGAIVKILTGDLKAGFNELQASMSGVGEELAREVKQADALEKASQKLEEREIKLIELNAKRKKQIEEKRLAAKNEQLDLEERTKLLEEAGNLEVKMMEDERAIAKERARISQERLELANSTREDYKVNAEAQAKVTELETESLKRRRTIESEKQSLIKRSLAQEKAAQKERIAAAQQSTEAAIKESKTRLQIYIEENEGKADTLKESIAFEEEVRDERLKILKAELEAKKLTQAEYELAVLQTKNHFLNEQTKLTEEHAQKELEIQREKDAQLKEIEQLKAEAKAADLQNKMEVEQGNFEAQMELEKQRMEMQRQQELAEAEKTGASKTLINKKYARIEEQIEYEKESTKRQMAADTFGGIAKLLGEQTAAGKAAAIAQATINTYQGITEVWRSPSILPEPFATIQKVVSTGTVLASGLGAVRKITSTGTNVPKAAKGTTLRGPSHADGGITLYDESGYPVVEAEGGENIHVLNKKASGLVNSLSYLNQATGGVPLTQATTYAAAGGMIQKNSSFTTSARSQEQLDYKRMAKMTAEAVRNVKIYTAVTEINDGQGKYADVVNGANF